MPSSECVCFLSAASDLHSPTSGVAAAMGSRDGGKNDENLKDNEKLHGLKSVAGAIARKRDACSIIMLCCKQWELGCRASPQVAIPTCIYEL